MLIFLLKIRSFTWKNSSEDKKAGVLVNTKIRFQFTNNNNLINNFGIENEINITIQNVLTNDCFCWVFDETCSLRENIYLCDTCNHSLNVHTEEKCCG